MRSDYPDIMGKIVSGRIDRPLGSSHTRFPDMIYPINYGYVDDVYAEDGEKQDVYLLGIDIPVTEFTGRVIAVYRRIDDVEDKWIVSYDGNDVPDEQILRQIHFQEQYFQGKLLR